MFIQENSERKRGAESLAMSLVSPQSVIYTLGLSFILPVGLPPQSPVALITLTAGKFRGEIYS